MSELMRFRLARAPQKRAVDPDLRVVLFKRPPTLEGELRTENIRAKNNERSFETLLNQALQNPNAFVAGFQEMGFTVLEQPANLASRADELDRWLTSLENRPSIKDLSAKLNTLSQSFDGAQSVSAHASDDLGSNARRFLKLTGNNWWRDRQNVGFNLIVAMLRDPEPSRAVYFNRLMLIFGLVELAAEKPDRLKTADDVYWALRSRSVILPTALLEFLGKGKSTPWLMLWAKGTEWVPLVGDFNGDGNDDVVVWNPRTADWQVALSNGSKFVPRSPWLMPWAQGTFWVPLVGDFNGDGMDDILVWNPQIGEWQVALSDGSKFVPRGQWLMPWAQGTFWVPLVGDFNGDGIDDIVVWNPQTGGWVVALSDGSKFVPQGQWLMPWAQGTEWVPLVGDFNGDGKDDIVVWNPQTGDWQVALSDGSKFVPQGQWLMPWAQGTEWKPLVGDFNGDGRADIVVRNPKTGDWQMALSDGSKFVPSGQWLMPWAKGSFWVPLVGDFNGDSRCDVAAWNPRTGAWLVALSNGLKFVSQSSRSLLARRPGFSDLYIVRDEWARYEAGEIAHVENVMASETRERQHTRLTENEETATTETERTKVDEHDTQTTDRFDLHEETSRDSSLNIGLDTSVDVSGQYGATSMDTHLGGSLDYSLNESQSKATTTAHETVTRAVVRVEEKVRQIRTTRSLSRIEEINKHSFKNDAPDAQHITGIYRWVDKFKRVQIFRYPNRFLLEFQIPEPGAWLRWLLDHKKPKTISENPKPLTTDGTTNAAELTPEHVTPDSYINIAARYKTLGLNPPPEKMLVNASFNQNTVNPRNAATIKASDPLRFLKLGDITIPSGYVAKKWYALIYTWEEDSWGPGTAGNIIILVGSSSIYAGGNDGFTKMIGPEEVEGTIFSGADPNPGIEQALLPVSIRLNYIRGFNIHITVECEPSETALLKWRFDAYEKIAQAYYAMKRQYDEELAAQSVRSGVQIQGQSPVQNAEMARLEIKKAVIEMLSGEDFTGRNAIQRFDANNQPIPPEIDLQKAIQTAPEIQFLEQAFEWENLTYILYPYFWAGKDQWDELADLSGPDPDFARFLRAGSARVVVPARPGFEQQTLLYVNYGILWGGGPAIAPDEEHYLSIAEEIRAQEKPPRDGIPGESWEVRLPTTLVWLDNVNSSLPVDNPKKELDAPPVKLLP